MKTKYYLFLLLTLLFGTGSCKKGVTVTPETPVSALSDRIYINPNTEFQTIDGFGASDAWRCQFVGKSWPIEKRNAIADLLFSKDVNSDGSLKGIGLSLWRFYIGAGSTEQGDASGIPSDWRRAECYLNADGTYDWTKQAGQLWFLKAAKQRGVEKFLGFNISAPVFYTTNGKAYAPAGGVLNLKPGKMGAYADFLVNVMDHFSKQEGITFDYLSPINEPQWDWTGNSQEGTPVTNAEAKSLVTLVSQGLTSKAVATKIVLSESGNLQALYSTNVANRSNHIYEFFNPASANYIGNLPNVLPMLSAHSYFTTADIPTLVSVRQSLAAAIKASSTPIGFWESEYCILENTADIGGGAKRDLTINTALFVAKVIHHDLAVANARSWSWWTALSESDYKDGLIYLDNGNNGIQTGTEPDVTLLKTDGFFRQSKLLWALGNYSRFIRPGMIRVDAGFSVPIGDQQVAQNVMLSAYKNPTNKQLVMVLINYTTNARTLNIGGLGKDIVIDNNSFTSYTTSETQNLTKGTMDATKIIIQPRSIITLVGTYK